MNSDIRINIEFFHHPKTLKLIKRLGHEGVFCLQQLWAFAAANRPTGGLTDMTVEDIELAAGWNGEEGKLVKNLTDIRFLDHSEVYKIHNWEKRQPWVVGIEKRSAAGKLANKIRWERDKSGVRTGCESDKIGCDSESPLPFPSLPNQLTPLSGNPDESEKKGKPRKPRKTKPDTLPLEWLPQHVEFAKDVLSYFNRTYNKRFTPNTPNLEQIVWQLQNGASVDDCRAVIDCVARNQYFTVENPHLFNPIMPFRKSNFEKYLNASRASPPPREPAFNPMTDPSLAAQFRREQQKRQEDESDVPY